jgi:hypothetical protein
MQESSDTPPARAVIAALPMPHPCLGHSHLVQRAGPYDTKPGGPACGAAWKPDRAIAKGGRA